MPAQLLYAETNSNSNSIGVCWNQPRYKVICLHNCCLPKLTSLQSSILALLWSLETHMVTKQYTSPTVVWWNQPTKFYAIATVVCRNAHRYNVTYYHNCGLLKPISLQDYMQAPVWSAETHIVTRLYASTTVVCWNPHRYKIIRKYHCRLLKPTSLQSCILASLLSAETHIITKLYASTTVVSWNPHRYKSLWCYIQY